MSVTKISSNFSEVLETKICYKIYENTNHLGNVLTTISDRKLAYDDASNGTGVDYFTADVVSYSDYYPFGWVLPQRFGPGNQTDQGGYRYGFQGQENDDNVHGVRCGMMNYKYRMHDTRLGRFFAIDPLAASFPWNSTYAFSENRVIDAIELEGLERVISITHLKGTKFYKLKVNWSTLFPGEEHGPAGSAGTLHMYYVDGELKSYKYTKTAMESAEQKYNNVKSSTKSFIQKLKEYENWMGTESEPGSSHLDTEIEEDDNGIGKPSEFNPHKQTDDEYNKEQFEKRQDEVIKEKGDYVDENGFKHNRDGTWDKEIKDPYNPSDDKTIYLDENKDTSKIHYPNRPEGSRYPESSDKKNKK